MESSLCGGRYALREQLADGLLGAVYRAEDAHSGADVALKIVAPGPRDADAQASVERALREHEMMSRVRHPLIARSFDAGEHEGLGYVAMELIEGEDLCTFINRRVADDDLVSLQRALPIVAQLCLALDAVHAAGLLHRDFKPANVMVQPDETIKLIDFGAAQGHADPFGLWGTPLYIAPEITLRRIVPVASRPLSDIYSLGVTVYELLTGQEPFALDGDQDVAAQLLSQARQHPRWLGILRPDLPDALSRLLCDAMSSTLADRPPTPRAFYRAFRAAAVGWGHVPYAADAAPYASAAATIADAARRPAVSVARAMRPTVPRLRRAVGASAPA